MLGMEKIEISKSEYQHLLEQKTLLVAIKTIVEIETYPKEHLLKLFEEYGKQVRKN